MKKFGELFSNLSPILFRVALIVFIFISMTGFYKEVSVLSSVVAAESEDSETQDSTDKTAAKKISSCTVTLSKTTYTYDGTEKTPKVKLINESGKKVSTDYYDVKYSHNVNAGTAKVVITGKGKYQGKTTVTFKIERRDISKANVTLSSTECVYNGKERKPAVTVQIKMKGSTVTLKKSKDYTVTRSKNTINVGTKKIVVKGTGNYKGTVKTEYSVIPKAAKITSLTSGKTSVTASWIMKDMKVTAYEIQCSTSSSFKEKNTITKTIKAGSGKSQKFSDLKENTTYYFRIRTYTVKKGEKYYSAWSSVKTKVTGSGTLTKSDGKAYFTYEDGTKAVSTFAVYNNNSYYFDENGNMVTGWIKVGDAYYYLDRSSGVQKKDCTVDDISISENGKADASSDDIAKIDMMITAREVYLDITDSDDTKAEKLEKCFNWVLKHPYHRYRILAQARESSTWMVTYAKDEFEKGSGCCVSEACALAFLANECGYTAYVCDDTGHAWVEIDGRVYDTLFAEAKSYDKYYNSTYKVAGLYRVNKTKI